MTSVDAVLSAAFPQREVEAIHAAGPSWNPANETVHVEFADGAVYLKIVREGEATRVARERAVIERVDATLEIPVPTVIGAAVEGDPAYLATAPVPGEPLLDRWDAADDEERNHLARAVGSAIARLHERRFDGHWRFTGGGADGLAVEHRPWPDLLADDVRYMRERAPDPRFPGYYDDLLAAIDANRDTLRDVPAALLHGDPARPNAFVVEGRVGFLDWERAHAGDPVRELCRARDQQFEPLRGEAPPGIIDAFHDGYCAIAGSLPDGYQERRPIYEAVRLTGPVGFFENYLAFDGVDADEFTDWLADEIDARLTAIR